MLDQVVVACAVLLHICDQLTNNIELVEAREDELITLQADKLLNDNVHLTPGTAPASRRRWG